MIKQNQYTRNWLYSGKSILFLTFLLIFSLANISTRIVQSPNESTLYEETIEIFWDQGVALNTSMVYNKGQVFQLLLIQIRVYYFLLFPQQLPVIVLIGPL